jgi:hypothetical protein
MKLVGASVGWLGLVVESVGCADLVGASPG